jgi:transposase
MRALPPAPYVYAEWKERTVAFDYHVEIDRHYYSVPHALVGHSVWARFTATTVEVFFRGERVTSHVRSYQRGAHTTLPEHMPKAHRAHAQWSPKQTTDPVGRVDRLEHRRDRRAPAALQAAPRTGLSRLPGTAGAGA